MKISIVTLSFNQCAYLKNAMDSILDQGYRDLEYIVVDPGSTDRSRELIQSYGGRISKVILEPDLGAADGLNKGFAVATGEVYGFLNADDLLMPGSLQKVADFFCQHPEREFAMGNGYIIDSEGERVRHIRARNFKLRPICYHGSDWLQQSTFFRRELFLRSEGFNIENRTCWDGELFTNMVSLGAAVGYMDEDLAQFRIYPSSITGSGKFKEQYQKDIDRIFARYQGHSWGSIDDIWRQIYRVKRLLSRATYNVRNWMRANLHKWRNPKN
jgi:glycosyltransferase involved in cell wall biosynthesis